MHIALFVGCAMLTIVPLFPPIAISRSPHFWNSFPLFANIMTKGLWFRLVFVSALFGVTC